MKKEPLSRKLSRGIFFLMSSSLISVGITTITVGFIARKLGVESFGFYSAVISFVGLFEVFTDFGLNKTILKFGSTSIEKTKTSFGNALFLKSVLILPTICLITFLGYLFNYRNEDLTILIFFSLSLILDSFATVFSSIRRVLGNFGLISFFRVFKTFINLLVVYFALSINVSVFSLSLASVVLSGLTFLVSLINSICLLKPRLDLQLIREFIQDSIIFSFNDFFFTIYEKIGIILLSFFTNLHTVGIYSAAVKFTRVSNLLPNQIRFALLPTMYKLLDKDSGDLNSKNKVFNILFKYLIILGVPMAVLIYFFAGAIISLIFGNKYSLSIPLLKIFSIFIFFRFIGTPFTLYYLAMNKHKNLLFVQAISSLINISLNLILIPRFSLYGTCLALIVSEVAFVFLLLFSGLKYSMWNIRSTVLEFIRPVLSGGISVFITNLYFHNIHVTIKIIFLLSVYFIFLLISKTFNYEDKALLKKIIGKKHES